MTHQQKHIRHNKYGQPFNAGLREVLPQVVDLRNTLSVIKQSGQMPKGKAWQYSRLKNMGLVGMQTKHTSYGGTIFGKVYLKKKAKNILESTRTY
jgi:hypothetical protein